MHFLRVRAEIIQEHRRCSSSPVREHLRLRADPDHRAEVMTDCRGQIFPHITKSQIQNVVRLGGQWHKMMAGERPLKSAGTLDYEKM